MHLNSKFKRCFVFLICTAASIIAYTESSAQLLGKSNLSRYNNINVFIDLQTEIPNTFFQTPITLSTVSDYVKTQFSLNEISYFIKNDNTASPLLRIQVRSDDSLNVGECSGNSFSVVFFVYENYDGRRFITWNADQAYLTVNSKADGKANGIWTTLGDLMNIFLTEWRETH